MSVFFYGKEGRLDGAEVCRVKVLGEFSFGNVLAEDTVCLVWVLESWLFLIGGGTAPVGCSKGHWSNPASR